MMEGSISLWNERDRLRERLRQGGMTKREPWWEHGDGPVPLARFGLDLS